MRFPLWLMRWMHKQRLSRTRLRGSFLHTWLGDRLLDKALWRPTRESLARAWLVGFPITVIPFLPIQSLFASVAALFVRGNLLLCIALQFLSTPLTAPIQLSACYIIGEVVRGQSPVEVWHRVIADPRDLLSGHAVLSLYLGAVVLGVVGGIIGYFVLLKLWRDRPPRKIRRAPLPPPAAPQ